ncbi:MAG: hypothetical protein OEZ25_03640 [Candidatus Bathyarchaeota archaeon]|nr:hypothetical protein [Candidatus Bathyarchaeota archaeon]
MALRKAGSVVGLVFMVSIIVMLFLSAQSLYTAYSSYQNGQMDQASYYFLFGAVGLASSIYALTKLRIRVGLTPPKELDVLTEIECGKCDFKNIREFTEGDYMLKTAENCPKCNEPMIMTSIYQKEKEKKGKGLLK